MVESWRSTYGGIIDQAFLDSMSIPEHELRFERILREQRHSHVVFVVDDPASGVVGFASGGRERDLDRTYLGELYAIYLLDASRRLGWGRALVGAVAGWLAERSMRSMLVWVLRENQPARRFYERLGGVYVRDTRRLLRGLELDEVSYGWLDTTSLIA